MILNVDVTALKKITSATIGLKSLTLPKGELTNIQLIIPSGHVGLTLTKFFYQGHQIWPLVTGSFRGNDTLITINPKLQINEQPRELLIQLINNDDTFTHTVYVIVEIDTQSNKGISINDLLSLGLEL